MPTLNNNNNNRRLSSSAPAAKRSSSSDNYNVLGKTAALPPHHAAKKRPALSNITNSRNAGTLNVKNSLSQPSKLVPCSSKVVSIKKGPSVSSSNAAFSSHTTSYTSKPSLVTAVKGASSKRRDVFIPKVTATPPPLAMDISPVHSEAQSESMSTCDSMNSPDIEYIDNNEVTEVDSIENKTSSKLCISEHDEAAGSACKREILADIEQSDEVMNIDDDFMNPQMCNTMACDIYKHLRATEAKKRPSTDFMERVQKDINASMRGILIDWLVEVAEEYRLVPDTLYLTVNYIDRYLSGNLMDRQRLQLLGVACMMIASKYEEICAPQVEEFCYITDNTYFKEEVLQMESDVLNYLKFEMTAPTSKCFLRRFIRAAQGVNEPQSLQVECLTNYVAELSLLEYSMLRYTPSIIAASSIFLARYILCPSKMPWNSTLQHYTLYHPSDLRECVMAIHSLTCGNPNSSLPAIREKYSQHKYKFVAEKYCPPSIPQEYFQDITN